MKRSTWNGCRRARNCRVNVSFAECPGRTSFTFFTPPRVPANDSNSWVAVSSTTTSAVLMLLPAILRTRLLL